MAADRSLACRQQSQLRTDSLSCGVPAKTTHNVLATNPRRRLRRIREQTSDKHLETLHPIAKLITLIASHLISSHLISSHLDSTHLVSSSRSSNMRRRVLFQVATSQVFRRITLAAIRLET